MFTQDEIQEISTKCYTQKIQQRKHEWIRFMNLLNEYGEIDTALEIGCYDGGTTVGLSHFCKTFTTIDLNPIRFDINTIRSRCNYTYYSANSTSTDIKTKIYDANKKLDLLFLDGDHTYEGVKKDYENFSPLVRSGGIIAFHDIVDSEYHRNAKCFVNKFWTEVKVNKTYTEIIYDNSGVKYDINNTNINPDVCWGGIGVIVAD